MLRSLWLLIANYFRLRLLVFTLQCSLSVAWDSVEKQWGWYLTLRLYRFYKELNNSFTEENLYPHRLSCLKANQK